MIDTNATFRSWLTTSAAIVALVGDNINCPDLPAGANPAAGEKWISFFSRGGTADLYVPFLTSALQLKAWARTAVEAREIYRAVFDLVHGASAVDLGVDGFIVCAWEQVQGQDLSDPDTGWATVLAFFDVTIRNA